MLSSLKTAVFKVKFTNTTHTHTSLLHRKNFDIYFFCYFVVYLVLRSVQNEQGNQLGRGEEAQQTQRFVGYNRGQSLRSDQVSERGVSCKLSRKSKNLEIICLQHPGGEDSLKSVAGRDGTKEFIDVGHSQEAR